MAMERLCTLSCHVAPVPCDGKQVQGASVVLGRPGAPLPIAPERSLRDRLPRQLTKAVPWVRINELVPVDPFEEGVSPEHYKQMLNETAKRSGIMALFFGGTGTQLPHPGQTPPNPITAVNWRGGRTSDVIVAVPGKSGTTFVQHICHQLRVRGHPPDFDDQMDVMNWLECGYPMYGHDVDAEHLHGPVRVIKSHLPYPKLPSGTKKIYVFRDLKDKIFSLYWFFLPFWGLAGRVTLGAFLDVWYPANTRAAKIDESLHDLVDWWNHRHDADVLFLFYDELIQQHRRSVERIASFMDLKPAAEESLINIVVEQTTHKAMASTRGPNGKDPFAEHNFADLCALVLGLRPDQRNPLVGKVRKDGGQTGQGNRVLPKEITKQIDESWSRIVEAQCGFKTLDEMIVAREAEVCAGEHHM